MKEIDLGKEILSATQYLKSVSISEDKTTNLYDTFTGLIADVITDQPKDSAEIIENYLLKQHEDNTPKDVEENIVQLELAETQIKLFEKATDDDLLEGAEPEDDFEIPLPNCSLLANYFEQAGVGIEKEEMFRIFLSLKQLVFHYPLASVRFWGKLLGLEANYFIAEVEFREGEDDEEASGGERKYRSSKSDNIKHIITTERSLTSNRRPRCCKCGLRKRTPTEEQNEMDERMTTEEEEGDETSREEDDTPKSTWKPPVPIPKEDHQTGANKKVYFVCNQPGDAWIKLPHVTPEEIRLARQITKFLTGNMEHEIISYPPFPFTETNYLRAQIARISAATQISPAGYFMFDDEEEEDEEEIRENYMANVDFEGLSLRELIDPSMINWVHHVQHILPQGRCTWFNPSEKVEDDFDEEEFDEEDMDENNPIAETGPQLLSSVQNDSAIGSTPAWTTYASSRVLPEYSIAVARSNRWPGAYAFSKDVMFENVYIGWGQKYIGECYTPPSPPHPFTEYVEDEETKELDDPTVAEEQEFKAQQEEALRAADNTVNFDDDDEDDDD